MMPWYVFALVDAVPDGPRGQGLGGNLGGRKAAGGPGIGGGRGRRAADGVRDAAETPGGGGAPLGARSRDSARPVRDAARGGGARRGASRSRRGARHGASHCVTV